MAGAVHAFLLLALMAVTVVAVWRTYRRPSRRRVAGSIGAGVLAMLLGSSFMHMCLNGQAFTQWLIPSVCVALSLAFVGPEAPRRAVVSASMVLLVLLTWHYVDVVHGPDFVGTQSAEGFTGPTRREWHSWISGLYRRTGPPPGRRPSHAGED